MVRVLVHTRICFLLVCVWTYVLFEELGSRRGGPHGAAVQRARQRPPPAFGGAHAALAPGGQSLFPGRVDQRQTRHLLAHLPRFAAQLQD